MFKFIRLHFLNSTRCLLPLFLSHEYSLPKAHRNKKEEFQIRYANIILAQILSLLLFQHATNDCQWLR